MPGRQTSGKPRLPDVAVKVSNASANGSTDSLNSQDTIGRTFPQARLSVTESVPDSAISFRSLVHRTLDSVSLSSDEQVTKTDEQSASSEHDTEPTLQQAQAEPSPKEPHTGNDIQTGYCVLCDRDMRCDKAVKPQIEAYYPCGHAFSQDCLFRARKGLGRIHINRYRKSIRRRPVAHCPREDCIWIVHDYCKHLAIPTAERPETSHTDQTTLWVPGPCESCAGKKAQRIHRSLKKWRAKHDGPAIERRARPGKIYRRLRKLDKL